MTRSLCCSSALLFYRPNLENIILPAETLSPRRKLLVTYSSQRQLHLCTIYEWQPILDNDIFSHWPWVVSFYLLWATPSKLQQLNISYFGLLYRDISSGPRSNGHWSSTTTRLNNVSYAIKGSLTCSSSNMRYAVICSNDLQRTNMSKG